METPTAPDLLTDYHEVNHVHDLMISEEIHDIDECLKKAYWRLIEKNLTDRQQEIIKLSAGGKTQTEIATKLKVNQSSITKSMHGNCDYKNGKKIYGGSEKKLRKIAEKDEEIQNLLKRKAELLAEIK